MAANAIDKDQLVAKFQEITGIDDAGTSLFYLEMCDWDIDAAVINGLSHEPDSSAASSTNSRLRSTVADKSASHPSTAARISPINLDDEDDAMDLDPTSKPKENPFAALKSQATEADDYEHRAQLKKYSRMINFDVEYEINAREQTINITLPDTSKIMDIKKRISSHLNVPTKYLKLSGFSTHCPPDDTVLTTLHLPANIHLTLDITHNDSKPSSSKIHQKHVAEIDDEESRKLSRSLIISVFNPSNAQVYDITVDGSKTMREFKNDVYSLTGIPTRRQKYVGFPDGIDDDSVFGLLKLDVPKHRVQIQSTTNGVAAASSADAGQDYVTLSSDESDDETAANFLHKELRNLSSPLEIIDDENSSHTNRVPLIPSDCDTVEEASENFVRVFEARYGDKHPFFNPISLEQAFIELQTANFRTRKPLLMYLHDDNSVSSQIFCSQVLCSPTMVDFINSNFSLWAWDLTFPENRTKVIEWMEMCIGHQNSLMLRVCTTDDFPVLMVFTKTRSGIENICTIKNTVVLEEIMVQLLQSLDYCHEQNRFEEADHMEREVRKQVVSEQEAAYQASLAADKLKAEQKVSEDMRKEAEERSEKEQKESRERERKRIEDQMKPEPLENSKEPFTTIRIRLPNSETVERRFLLVDCLKTLFDFAAVKGFAINEHRLLTSFPKRDLSTLDAKTTFKELNFATREAVVIEQK